MMCMRLERTGNLGLVKDWILTLREPFDCNNAGVCEPDNLWASSILDLTSLGRIALTPANGSEEYDKCRERPARSRVKGPQRTSCVSNQVA
jgi:hypothetical protein